MSRHQTVLFLCTGNFYRSRHAEAVFNHLAIEKNLCWQARSRGFRPHLATEDLSHWTVERLDVIGVPVAHTGEKPRPLRAEDLAEASLVIALRRSEHLPMMAHQFPRWGDRIRYWDVADIDELSPAHALPMIESEVEQLVDQLRSGHALGADQDVFVEF